METGTDDGLPGKRHALIIANYDYEGEGLSRLRAPVHDAEQLAAVLADPAIGAFSVRTVVNESAAATNEAVESFFADRDPDDLLVLYFSGHGVKDESGDLYFATAPTRLELLAATAVSADFVNRRMSRTRARKVVLLLDCCYSGAFGRGMVARAGTPVGIKTQFEGSGRAVITASSALEYAFEGSDILEDGGNGTSVFTSALVEGLVTGEADHDQDGYVGLDELYDYIFRRVRHATPNQTPGKWTFGVEGALHLARRSTPVVTPAVLPDDLRDAVDHRYPPVRVGAVEELGKLLAGRHAGFALAARLALRALLDDDSTRVSTAAAAALGVEAVLDDPPEPADPADLPEPAVPADLPGPAGQSARAQSVSFGQWSLVGPRVSVAQRVRAKPVPGPPRPTAAWTTTARVLAAVAFSLLVIGYRSESIEIRYETYLPGIVATAAFWGLMAALVALVGLPARAPGRGLVRGLAVGTAALLVADLAAVAYSPQMMGVVLGSSGVVVVAGAMVAVVAAAADAVAGASGPVRFAFVLPSLGVAVLVIGKPAIFDDYDPSPTWPILAGLFLLVQLAGVALYVVAAAGRGDSIWRDTAFPAVLVGYTVVAILDSDPSNNGWSVVTLSIALAAQVSARPEHVTQLLTARAAVAAVLVLHLSPTGLDTGSFVRVALVLALAALAVSPSKARSRERSVFA